MDTSKNRILNITYVAAGAALLAVCAWLTIPFGPVPFTMQTFAVFAIAAAFGWKRSVLSVLIYLGIGAVGAPVFSGFGGGLGALLGVTGGYLIGFLFTALIIGFAADRFPDKTLPLICSVALGMLAYYTLGSVWFMVVYTRSTGSIGMVSILAKCVFPYIIPDAAKGVLAILVAKRLRKVVK